MGGWVGRWVCLGGCMYVCVVRVCACACARVRVGACARVCACVCMSALACLPVFANSISLLPRKKVSSWARRRRPRLPLFFLASAGTPRPQTRAPWLVHARGCQLQAVTGHTGVGVEPAAWCTLVAVGYGQLRAVAAVCLSHCCLCSTGAVRPSPWAVAAVANMPPKERSDHVLGVAV